MVEAQGGSVHAVNDLVIMESTGPSLTCCVDIKIGTKIYTGPSVTNNWVRIGIQDENDFTRNISVNLTDTTESRVVLAGDTLRLYGTGVVDDNVYVESDGAGVVDNPTKYVTIENVGITGKIDVGANVFADTLFVKSVDFGAGSREIIDINSTEAVILVIPAGEGLYAASGSTITNSGGNATLICNGNTKSMTYTWNGTPDDCFAGTSPP